MRLTRWAITVALAAVLVVGIAGAFVSSRKGTEHSQEETRYAFGVSQVQESIGETIEDADLIVRAHVVGLSEPVWNSSDGRDWVEAYNKNPSAYEAGPITVAPATLLLEEVLKSNPKVPTVVEGDKLEAYFLEPALQVGEERVLMLDWTEMYGEMKEPREVWLGDSLHRAWAIDNGTLSPIDEKQAYSLGSAILRKDVTGTLDEVTWRGAVTLDVFKSLVTDELGEKGINVAGFDEWPSDEAYARYQEDLLADDPEARPDPEEV